MLNAGTDGQRSVLGDEEPPTPAGPCSHHPRGKASLPSSPLVSCPHMEAISVPSSQLGLVQTPSTPRVTTRAPARVGASFPLPQVLAAAGQELGRSSSSSCSAHPSSGHSSLLQGPEWTPWENIPEIKDSECAKQVWGIKGLFCLLFVG